MNCDHCHLPIPDSKPIYRVVGSWGSYGRGFRGSMCGRCCEETHLLEHRHWHAALPCIHCGRPVFYEARRDRPRYYVVCGKKCQRAAYAARAADRSRQRRRQREQQHACAQCGVRFEPKRGDARYCSSACRQAAYRQRVGFRPLLNPEGEM
jgi:hypothetical protein